MIGPRQWPAQISGTLANAADRARQVQALLLLPYITLGDLGQIATMWRCVRLQDYEYRLKRQRVKIFDCLFSDCGLSLQNMEPKPRGRPRGKRWDRVRACCLSSDVDERLEKLAARLGIPVSELLRLAIDDLVSGKFMPTHAFLRPV
jgi:hypothetical protein